MTQTNSDLLDENIRLANVAGAQGEALEKIRIYAGAALDALRDGHPSLASVQLQYIQEAVLSVSGLRANQEPEAQP